MKNITIFFKDNGKGILLCFVISLPIWLLTKWLKPLEIVGAPIIAILAGMVISLILKGKSKYQNGIAFSSKKILQWAVVLLGFGLNLSTVGKV